MADVQPTPRQLALIRSGVRQVLASATLAGITRDAVTCRDSLEGVTKALRQCVASLDELLEQDPLGNLITFDLGAYPHVAEHHTDV